jgi:hypothetical protein
MISEKSTTDIKKSRFKRSTGAAATGATIIDNGSASSLVEVSNIIPNRDSRNNLHNTSKLSGNTLEVLDQYLDVNFKIQPNTT